MTFSRPLCRVIGILLLAALPVLTLAGTTGKIAGRITDASSGEALVSVNVVVEGTTRGAATDLDGYYFIINLSPGTYTLNVSAIGYKAQAITNVQVSIDKTSEVDVELEPEVIQGEAVTVVAQRPAVEKDRTFSTATVGDQDMQVMPVNAVSEVVNIQAGVVDGHFRGGRSGEVVYMIDGIPVQDVYDNSQATGINQDVVKELQVITGTFNAEYGQAMSGVVNMVTKDGGDRYTGMASTQFGDYYSGHTKQFDYINNINPAAITNYEVSLAGPVPLAKGVSFYLNGRGENNDGWLYGRRKWDLQFMDKFMQLLSLIGSLPAAEQASYMQDSLGLDPALLNDQEQLYLAALDKYGRGNDAAVPMNNSRQFYGFGKLTFQLTPTVKLNFISMAENRDYRDFDRDFLYIPEGDFKRFRRSRTNTVKVTNSIGNSAFMETGFSNSYNEYYHYVYKDPFDPRYYYYVTNLLDLNPTYTLNVNGVKFEHFKRFTNSNTFQSKLAWQINKTHYFVTGINLSLYNVYYQSFNDDIADVGPTYFDTSLPYGVSFQDYLMNGVRPDISKIPVSDFNLDRYNYSPVEFSIYSQDKIELQDLVVNVGVRLDYFDSNGKVLADPKDPDVYHPYRIGLDQTSAQRLKYWYKDPTAKVQVSPRLGIGYPISDSGVLHFAYGHFFQRPPYEYLYADPEFEIKRQGAGLHTIIGNADLDAEKTISYEFGFEQALTQDLSCGISLYQRDIRGLIAANRIIETYSPGVLYAQYANQDIAEIRGVILSFDKRYSNNFSASVDYTYQIAEGVASDPADAFNALNAKEQPIVQLIPLNWDRRHTLNLTVNYYVQHNWGASIIGTIGSGLPYTISTGQSKVQTLSLTFQNDGRKPTYLNADLNMFKEIPILPSSGISGRLELMVRNLFDRLNENDVFKDTGRATYRTDVPLDRSGEHADFTTFDEYFLYYPQYYSRPREVRVGFSVNF